MSSIPYVNDEMVKAILDWNSLIETMERALIDVSKNDGTVIQPPRLRLDVPQQKGVLLTMPAYSGSENSLGCKLVTSFPDNKSLGIPSIFATILLLDSTTGRPKAVLEGSHITGWRTAAASAVATKYLHNGPKNILAILGSGVQAESHALVLNHLFHFEETRIWGRTKENAEGLASSLPFECRVCDSIESCVADADVVCTTTYATEPYLRRKSLKKGVLINAVGAAMNHYSELEEEIYRNAFIAVEHMESAKKELKGLLDKGIEINDEIGEFILGKKKLPLGKDITVYQSLGMAVEDIAAANLVYNIYSRTNH